LALFRCEKLGSGPSAFHSPRTPLTLWRIPLGFANRVLGFASGDVEDLLGELDGITRTFGHEASMPQVSGYFETETLPARAVLNGTTMPPRNEARPVARWTGGKQQGPPRRAFGNLRTEN